MVSPSKGDMMAGAPVMPQGFEEPHEALDEDEETKKAASPVDGQPSKTEEELNDFMIA